MSVEPFGVAIFVIGLACMAMGLRAVAIAFVLMNVFVSAAAAFLGQNTIQPAHLFLAFLLVAVGMNRAAVRTIGPSLGLREPGFWLCCLVVYGVLAAALLPRVFAGMTDIVPLGTTAFDASEKVVPLVTTSSNFSQSVYLIGNLLCFLATAAVASTDRGRTTVVVGLIAYAGACALFAVIDLATYATGTQAVLDFMRNAKYTLHHEEEVVGLKRIVGSFTEASVFARSMLGVLGFTATLWLFGQYRAWTGMLAASAVVLLILSTSTTALVGLPVMAALLYATAWQAALTRERVLNWAVVIIAPVLLLVLALALLLDSNALAFVTDYLNTAIFSKMDSASGVERSQWNTLAFQNFLDTWGIGVGVGTARASNFMLALLSSVGVVGALLYLMFLASAFVQPRGEPRSNGANVQDAARNACVGLLVGDLLVASSIDQGMYFYVLAGLAAAIPIRNEQRAPTLPHAAMRPA